MLILEVEPLDLGPDVRAVGLDLVESEVQEPARGSEAAQIWSRVIPAIAGAENWSLDFFSHLDGLRKFCESRNIPFREASQRCIVVSALPAVSLAPLLERFERETFGVRAGEVLKTGDPALENELARRGVDAYHTTYPGYFFCAIFAPEDGSLVVLSQHLWASEIARRARPVLAGLEVQVQITS
ncbi:MAG TPA: hypothetical protein VJN21_03675 [Candidatus Acidoferrales bacterium]|nr:hypothetical protein [Candidatus Acidoferrales bacterium]